MTHVEFLYDNNIIIGYELKGHAGFNLNGPDIVCASLSATSQMTLNGILDWTGLDDDEVVQEVNEVYGVLRVLLPRPHHNNITVQQLLKSFELFITQLSEQYPKNVKVRRRDINDNRS